MILKNILMNIFLFLEFLKNLLNINEYRVLIIKGIKLIFLVIV